MRLRARRWLRPAGIAASVALALAAAGAARAQGAGGTSMQTLSVPGLREPARIDIDTWGVPHIVARSTDDAFFVQGFNAARDRLFQIDLWRRRGLGRLAAAFGPGFVEQDRAARLFLYRGDMAAEWQAYGADAQRIATRFVAGINAYVDLLGRGSVPLPLEFAQFRYAPEKWQPEDVVRIRSHGLARNVASELQRALAACRGMLAADEVRVALKPPWRTRVPPGLDPCIPGEALRAYGLATQGVHVRGRDGQRAALEATPLAAPGATPEAAVAAAAALPQGSNAWVVAPARSATGRPILASDPHRLHAAPSLRYIVHLSAPGLDAIGGGEPALPGISIGHNGRIAFGLTVFAIDQEDLYVYETQPGEPTSYRYRDGWEPMRAVQENIEVRGQPAQSVTLHFTRHGPVTHIDRGRQRAYAVRAAWLEPGMAPYFGSIGLLGAQDLAGFRRTMARWGAPAENQVYADVDGHIAWVTGGLAPRRPNWDGLLPVPGDGRYEWDGFWPGEQLPALVDPAAGWFASANELNLPADYPWRERQLGFEWSSPSRHQRIAEVLGALPKVSLEDSLRLQNDVLSVPARRLQPLWRALKPSDGDARAAQQVLAGWDLQLRGDSAAAALFELWWSRHLGVAYRDAVLAPAAAALTRTVDEDAMLRGLERPHTRWARDATARRDRVLESSLALAWADLQALAGADPARWRWDALHQAFFGHPLANAGDDALRTRLNVGPMPKQGGSASVNLSSYDPGTLRQVAGPSLRLVLDVGAWDNSRAVNAPGQSGDPASPHYRDLAPLWLTGQTFPLLYTRQRIEAALAKRIELLPAPATPAPGR